MNTLMRELFEEVSRLAMGISGARGSSSAACLQMSYALTLWGRKRLSWEDLGR